MPRRIDPLLFVLAVGAVLAGCGVNTGFVHDAASGDQHQYRMEVASTRYERTAAGRSSSVSALCLVPFSGGLYAQAMQELQSEAHLGPNEVLENVRTDDDPSCYLVVGVRSLTISADIYLVVPASSAAPTGAPQSGPAPTPPLPKPPPPAPGPATPTTPY